jgi:superfamily II DNA/RNA helicase
MGNLFRALAYSLDNALSPYLLNGTPEDYKEFVTESPKIAYVMDCIATVKKWHEDHQETASGQVIYMNRGKQFFPLVKEYLEKEIGYKKGVMYDRTRVDEVEIISSEVNDTRKELIKEAFLDGVVKIIIGTATIREGIDLQKRGTVIYNCYPEWNPTDIRQLEGRIWRQGNQFQYVRIVMPLVQDSMDVFVFQKLEEKTSRINDIWFRGDRGNVLDLESMDPEEIKLALITDVDRLVAMFFDQAKENLNRDYKRVTLAIDTLKEVQSDINYYNTYREKSLGCIQAFHTTLLNSSYLKETPKVANDGEVINKTVKRAKELKEEIELLLNSTDQQDKDIISIGRKIDSSYSLLGIYFSQGYYLSYFKEYVSKVRKTERTLLKPKGYSLSSDLSPVMSQYEADKQAIVAQSELYRGDQNSPKWAELKIEIQAKKSALQVEGRSAQARAEEFNRLNYLLEYRTNLMPAKALPSNTISELELEALAFELELELINF